MCYSVYMSDYRPKITKKLKKELANLRVKASNLPTTCKLIERAEYKIRDKNYTTKQGFNPDLVFLAEFFSDAIMYMESINLTQDDIEQLKYLSLEIEKIIRPELGSRRSGISIRD